MDAENFLHSGSGYFFLKESESLLAASPIISILLTKVGLRTLLIKNEPLFVLLNSSFKKSISP